MLKYHSCTRTGFVGWLSTTLDQSVELLIGLWQNTELGVCKKHLMYIILFSFRKLHHSFSSWVLQLVEFAMVINTKRFQNLYEFLGNIIKILVLLAFLSSTWFDFPSVIDNKGGCLAKIIIQKKKKIQKKITSLI